MQQRPLSVMEARDPEVLQLCLDFYVGHSGLVVDVTANRRRMWEGVVWTGLTVFCDNDPVMEPDRVCDFRALPFADGSIDCLVFDPPHLPAAAASAQSLPQMAEDYGLASAPKADHVGAYFQPFLIEAARVLRPDGVIIAKLKDYVHNHRYQWMLVEWIEAVRTVEGLTPCDLIIKRDPCGGNLKSGRWEKAHHVRNAHCWFAIVRKGHCERRKP